VSATDLAEGARIDFNLREEGLISNEEYTAKKAEN
jgi:hypothetical protein